MKLLMPLQLAAVVLATLSWASAALLFAFLGLPRIAWAFVRLWCRTVWLALGVRYRVTGLENVPAEGSYLVASSHCSHLDGPTLILAFPHPIYFVIKKELARIPIWGWAAVRVGFIAIERGSAADARKQLRAAAETIRSGRRVLIFPEGTRSPDGGLLPFKKGGFYLAANAGVPILPVVVNGSRRLLPKGRFRCRPGVVEVVIGEPIPTTGLGREGAAELLERTRAVIEAMRSRDPDYPGEAAAVGDQG